jgi:DsbC/DsbD-like thiol-disulfide interchange protein
MRETRSQKSTHAPGRLLRLTLVTALLAGLASAAVAQFALPDGVVPDEPRVTVRLLTDVKQVAPGERFWIAAVFDLAPDWHIYWRNPGDAGSPTRVEFTLPDGVEKTELHWPRPTRFEQPGGLVGYGYENQAAFLLQARAPESIEPGQMLSIEARTDWLVCREVCIPGDKTLAAAVRIGETTERQHEQQFRRWRDQLPADNPSAAGVRVLEAGGTVGDAFHARLRFERPVDQVDWFPHAYEIAAVEDVNLRIGDDARAATLRFTLEPFAGQTFDADRVTGLLVWRDEAGRHAAPLSIPVDR